MNQSLIIYNAVFGRFEIQSLIWGMDVTASLCFFNNGKSSIKPTCILSFDRGGRFGGIFNGGSPAYENWWIKNMNMN